MNSGGLAVMLICEGRLFSEEIGSSYNTCEFCEYVRIRANTCEYLREYLRIHLRIHLQKKKKNICEFISVNVLRLQASHSPLSIRVYVCF